MVPSPLPSDLQVQNSAKAQNMSLLTVDSIPHLEEIIISEEKNKLLVLFFYTPTSESCKQVSRKIREVSVNYTKESVKFLIINAESSPDLFDLFKLTSVSSLVLVRNGYVLRKLWGRSLGHFINTVDECAESIFQSASDESYEFNRAIGNEACKPELNPALTQKLSNLVQAAPAMLFLKGTPSEPYCGYSRQIVKLLRDHNVRFGYFNVLKNDVVRKAMKNYSDWPTFPQLYLNGEFQGGLDIIKESLQEDPEFFKHVLQ
ncbi:hypothetical protein KAFR_0B02600 [Kazachstania africana CBS 2517]|uniref:Uncharacterized protein n=1 Tax=Kazachstania africana (strain ATCC 22294 / BCRC 22015 / CBS 2517 / CECT 1963 / NBRC 1671 / NRRL Y-8276) TaxID=1071382 RepID=H2AQA7_KAZAF|nr:hypothetical protein KAFR_0B02600 [Kazachstania africana CBS 2517]CCF56557.1 hypothetical protein KAFR_0B02600 [Kazachstania africana CBS 2517]